MKKLTRTTMWFVIAMAAGLLTNSAAYAERFDDGIYKSYEASLKGKRVAFIPMAMTIEMDRGWVAGMKRQADHDGYQLIIRDPNWKVDAAVQAVEQLINEKPDVLILHADDLVAFSKPLKKANDAGIRVIQLNLKSPATNGDAYVGADWYDVGRQEAVAAVNSCGQGSGKSGEIAIIHGPGVSPGGRLILPGMEDELAKHKEIKVVSRQSSDWDVNKARSIASTLLKQHPNLCGFVGLWDGVDIGISNAVKQAGLTGKVAVITEGGGSREGACNQVSAGNFTAYVNIDTRGQAIALNSAISMLLQTKPKPGSTPFALYTASSTLTKKNMTPASCWTVDEVAAGAN